MDLIIDLKDLDRYTHVGIKDSYEAIKDGIGYIITPHISLIIVGINAGYNVFMTNNEDNVDLQKLTRLNKDSKFYELLVNGVLERELCINLVEILGIEVDNNE